MRLAPVALALLLATAAAAAEPSQVCDIGTYPAATLLLPYFEVDFQAPATSAVNTVFTIVNTSNVPQIARVTIWTDWGFPASWFNVFLSGYDAQTVSMYEIVARGRYPVTTANRPPGALSAPNLSNPKIDPRHLCNPFGGTMQLEFVQRLQRVLTTGVRDDPECRVGGKHDRATGYVTIDVVNSCSIDSPLGEIYWKEVVLHDNVLTGESIRMNPDESSGNYSGATPLVHIRAVAEASSLPFTFYDRLTPAGAKKIDRRQPLPSTFAARYIAGGAGDFQTNLTMWREPASIEACRFSTNGALPLAKANVVRFDEHENATALAAAVSTPVSMSVPVTSDVFPPMPPGGDRGGWMWIHLDHGLAAGRASQSWIAVQMSAEGRYAVDLEATWLANACTPPPTAP